MPTLRIAQRKHAGFTLIEILITVLVLSIGLLGLAGMQISGLRANMSSEARSKATLLASDIAERMRNNPLGVQNKNAADDNKYDGITTANEVCSELPDPFCSNYRDQHGEHTAGDCTPAQMAAFDAWVWACGMPKADGVVQGGVDHILKGGTGSVTCNDSDTGDGDTCSPGSSYTITVSWNELAPNSSQDVKAGEVQTKTYSLVVVP
jgi:type IV pilus assembly protein PilV